MKGSGGIYTVAVGDAIVAKKTLSAGFPTDDEVIDAVRRALAPS